MSRRIAAALAALALALLPGTAGPARADEFAPAGLLTTTTPIKHFVVLMQENHSFDNYFGTYPGADGIPAGTCMPTDPSGATGRSCVPPFHLDGRGVLDLTESPAISRRQFRDGQMNGFLSAFAGSPVGDQPMGYYDGQDLPYYWNVADDYVLFDAMFAAAAGGSVWNHFFWVTGTPGNPDADRLRPGGFDDVPTIFDRLQAAGISWKFYVENYRPDVTFRTPSSGDAASQTVWVPLLNYNRFLDEPALNSRIVDMSQYQRDLQDGTLPAVSFLVPSGASEHPPGSVQAGQRFVRSLLNALMSSSAWASSAFMWTYDNSGGWYDHVPPPSVDRYGYGFRVPALLVSPYARRGYVDHTQLDVTSELKFIEDNWGVPPLAERDSRANDLTGAFDFSSGPRAPVLLSETRGGDARPPTRSGLIYLSYGLALLPVPLFSAVALRRRRAGGTPPEQTP